MPPPPGRPRDRGGAAAGASFSFLSRDHHDVLEEDHQKEEDADDADDADGVDGADYD